MCSDKNKEIPGESPDGTIPQQQLPIKVLEQRIPCESPESADEIIRTLAPHEGDAIVKDGDIWVYRRTRCLVDWNKVQKMIEDKQKEEAEEKTSGLVGPNGEALPLAQPPLPFPEPPDVG